MMTNKSGTLYIGVTNDIERRVWEHRTATLDGFTRRYKMDRLVYYEDYPDPSSAIEREKQLKGWLRRKKIELIREANPRWEDLADGWFDEGLDSSLRSE
ncbi:MAG: GIY-YIG nuclease family protein [Dehalococcoidia bacterium]